MLLIFTDQKKSFKMGEERSKIARRVTWVGFFMNLALTIFKLTAGIVGKSTAMVADAIHSLSDFVTDVIVIVLITVGLAVALAMGLGSREIAGQILAGIYVRELYQVGQEVRVGEVEGQIEEIGTVKTTLLTDEGELVSISNRILLEQHVTSR